MIIGKASGRGPHLVNKDARLGDTIQIVGAKPQTNLCTDVNLI